MLLAPQNAMKYGVLIFSLFLTVGSNSASAAGLCESIFGARPAALAQPVKASKEDIYIRAKTKISDDHMVRRGRIAAHMHVNPGTKPYFFMAFPEGNSGVGIWMKSPSGPVRLTLEHNLRAVSGKNGMHGGEVSFKTNVARLELIDFALGSMRFIRDRELDIAIPEQVKTTDIKIEDGTLILRRKSINELVDYAVQIIPLGDTRIEMTANGPVLVSSTTVRFKSLGLLNEPPLTPIHAKDVFKPEVLARISPEKLQAFSFLLYKEKLMAGAPRYFTKFGRDSIYTLRVLMDSMKPEAIESLLSATMSSMNPVTGRVSHEQHEGDFASYVRLKEGKPTRGNKEAIEDYKMVDDDFAFVFVLGQYMRSYPERVGSFLNGKDLRGNIRGQLAEKLFDYVMNSTSAFSRNQTYKNLIRIEHGDPTGQWRDSHNGLGRGVYPFDVNAAFVPSALRTLAQIYGDRSNPLFNPALAMQARTSFTIWNTKVVPMFEVRVTPEEAKVAGDSYLRSLKIDPALVAKAPTEDIVFSAVSLSTKGEPVRIMHSDDSLMMTFGTPSETHLKTVSQRVDTEFPYGLTTPVGILVANPVFASPALKKLFGTDKYHGTVSWAMQEDLLFYGLSRQIARTDISAETKAALRKSRNRVQNVIAAKAEDGGIEVSAIVFQNGKWARTPFVGDAKPNPDQLWSHLLMTIPALHKTSVDEVSN